MPSDMGAVFQTALAAHEALERRQERSLSAARAQAKAYEAR